MSKRKALETAFTRYELIDVVGQGGTDRVWRATDLAGATVAVKVWLLSVPTPSGVRDSSS